MVFGQYSLHNVENTQNNIDVEISHWSKVVIHTIFVIETIGKVDNSTSEIESGFCQGAIKKTIWDIYHESTKFLQPFIFDMSFYFCNFTNVT